MLRHSHGRMCKRRRENLLAWMWCEWFVAFLNLSLLRTSNVEQELESALGSWDLTEKQEFCYMQNFGRLRRVARLSGKTPLPIGRGAQGLHHMLSAFEQLDPNIESFNVDQMLPRATGVDLQRVSVPASAGVIDPQACLASEKAAAVATLASEAVPPRHARRAPQM